MHSHTHTSVPKNTQICGNLFVPRSFGKDETQEVAQILQAQHSPEPCSWDGCFRARSWALILCHHPYIKHQERAGET